MHGILRGVLYYPCSMVLRQDLQLKYTLLGLLSLASSAQLPQLVSNKFFEEEIFAGTNFRELAFDRENHENIYLVKISRYTV